MSLKYTPGPLTARKASSVEWTIATQQGRVVGFSFGALNNSPEEQAELEANAKLWAAAPELLGLWLEYFRAAKQADDARDDSRSRTWAEDEQRAAVFKAYGLLRELGAL